MLHPKYAGRDALHDQIRGALDFYHPRCVDPSGGFYHQFAEDGTRTDDRRRSLIMSCRFIFVHALGHELFGAPRFADAVQHGTQFLYRHHRNPDTLGYANVIAFEDGRASIVDGDNVTYGLIFAVLAYAMAIRAGYTEAGPWLEELVETLETRVYEPDHRLYADQASADWSRTLHYRGQNANMHACEAMLFAYEATKDGWYLDRARSIAGRIAFDLSEANPEGEVWEHFHSDWTPDFTYNEDDHSEPQRPFGYLSGHQTEWAKLLIMLNRHDPREAYVDRAVALFDHAMTWAWDGEHGGLFYSRRPNGAIYEADKHQWTHAESIAAAGLLFAQTGEARFADWHNRLWDYADRHLLDHERGGWFRMLDSQNRRVGAPRGEPEPDYHNIGACFELLRGTARPEGSPQ